MIQPSSRLTSVHNHIASPDCGAVPNPGLRPSLRCDRGSLLFEARDLVDKLREIAGAILQTIVTVNMKMSQFRVLDLFQSHRRAKGRRDRGTEGLGTGRLYAEGFHQGI